MADAIWESMQKDTQTILRAASLTGISSENITVAMLPKADQTVDVLPKIAIAPHGKMTSEAMNMSGGKMRRREVEVCLIDGIEDMATGQNQYHGWQDAAANAIEMNGSDFRTELPNVPSLFNIEIVEAPTFDRSKLSQLYSYQSILVRFTTQE